MPPLERNPRYRTLDTWRGVACLMVVLHHAGFVLQEADAVGSGPGAWLRWGIVAALRRMDLGVPLFFVISGYCIAASVDATRRRGSSSWDFLRRRLRRIYPPYWAALLVFVLVTAGLDAAGLAWLHRGAHALELDSPGALDPIQWIGNITLTETWRPHVFGHYSIIYTRIAWSLCYEEQFYFLCFVLLLLFPRRLYGAWAAVTLAITATTALAWDSGGLARLDGTFFVRWHQFAIGMAVYWRLNVPASNAARRLVDLLILAVLAGSTIFRGAFQALPLGPPDAIYDATAVTAAFGIALILLRPLDDRAEAAAWLAPLRACGRRCYSIYLVHLPVCVVGSLGLVELGLSGFWARAGLVVPLVSLAAVGVCWIFFAAVERHFLNPPIVRRVPSEATSPHPHHPLAGEDDASSHITSVDPKARP